MSHSRRMLIGCLAAFGLLFLLPILGIGVQATVPGFLVVMFLCHQFMLRGHGRSIDWLGRLQPVPADANTEQRKHNAA